jgi:ribose transport system ATP-binding protein
MTTALLEARQVAKRYGSVVALRRVDLTVRPGEIHALLGANGAGKSTLVKILSGVIKADAGTIQLDGQPLRPRNPIEALGAGLGTVFQDPALVPDLTIDANLRLTGVDRDKLAGWVRRLELERLDLGAFVRDVPLPTLRMLDLARALAGDATLLMLDEITAALPGDQVELVFSVMSEWRERGRSVLFITHRLAEVLRMCDRATILRDGNTVAEVVPGDGGVERLVEPMLGERVAQAEVEAQETEHGSTQLTRDAGPVTLAVRDITARQYLNGMSFELHAGEILGIVALEGQGQDRLFDVLSGGRPFDGGQLVVGDHAVKPLSPYDMIRRGVVLVPSDRLQGLLPQRPLRENLASALYNRFSRWFSLAGDERSRVADAISRLEIDTRAARQVRRLSGGNQQKVVIGRWLAAGFRTLLCFDPTRGIDVGTKAQIYDLLHDLARQGAAILYYTSEFAEVPLVCDRVLVVYDGRVVSELDSAVADEATLLNAAHGLEEAAS